ncbi:sigma-70 family RNA polymerase sigma factor [Anditalea andensis]|uniref:HTH luxR-type domain-containing protein n=1 Tax=Anditalea andensis TaxID=1048983 RepID=A0A074LDL2_9BACT|nr:sigma-70 family RNA polymerase sigma factor [Anditalea andensis]KEO71882.1 hypothetical protein EL17_20390 [Anditalea andensis]
MLFSKNQFNAVFEEHWEVLYKAAYSRIQDQAVVEDMLQDIFIDLWSRRDSIIIRSTLKAYLLTAVKYRVLKFLHQKNQYYIRDIQGLDFVNATEEEVHPFDLLYERLEVVLQKLPEKNRLIFKLSKLEGYSTQEIADKLDISSQTVHNHLTKSMKIIRTELSDATPLLLYFFLP